MPVPYTDSVTSKADGTGKAIFNFRTAAARHVIQCSVTVDQAPAAAVSKATAGVANGVGRPWGSWNADTASQGLQFISPETLSVVTTGLTAGSMYTAFLEGVDYDTERDFVQYMAPSQPYSTSVSVAGGALNFQHNDVLVAAEPAVDFEDGSGVTWTLTDDPGANRMKVAAAVSTASFLLARSQYAPGTTASYNIGSTGTLATIDGANLTTGGFVAPASGDVIVGLFGGAFTTNLRAVYLGLYDHGTTNLRGFVQGGSAPSAADPLIYRQLITGLVAGNSYQFDLAATTSAGGLQLVLAVQGNPNANLAAFNAGPVVIEVWSA